MALKRITRARARQLRGSSTDAERRLWGLLRSRRLTGLKFRRQHAVGEFIVDFVCLERMLVVELDGGQQFLRLPEMANERST